MITSEKLALRLTKSIKPLQWGNCMVEMTLKSKCYSSSKANTQKNSISISSFHYFNLNWNVSFEVKGVQYIESKCKTKY